jgi:hypothetical protein
MTGFGMPLEVAKSTGCGRTCVRIALPTWKRIWTLRKNSYASLRRRTQKRLKALLPEWEARNLLNTVGSVAKSIPGTSVIGMILAQCGQLGHHAVTCANSCRFCGQPHFWDKCTRVSPNQSTVGPSQAERVHAEVATKRFVAQESQLTWSIP